MKQRLSLLTLFIAIIFTISSCTKTGPQGPSGPSGPLLTGALTGFVTTYDQYGFKVLGDLQGVVVHISDSTSDSTVTDATGKYTFANLKTGVYNLTYSKPGYATVTALDYGFVGGGTLNRNAAISRYPSFSVFNVASIDTTIATDPGMIVRGNDTADQVARTFIVFGSNVSTVSSTPGNYIYANTGTIKAGQSSWNLFITSQELHDNGFASGSQAYFVVYPISTGSPTFVDPSTGRTVYTAIGSVPSTVLTVTIP